MAARVYVVLNKKGGVGKTSTCFHLAGHPGGLPAQHPAG
jgi:hypothetical protein